MDEQMKRKNNLKLYPIYKMFSWDLLFYYAISFLFLTQTKGLSVSKILFIDAFYPFFKIIFQIICITIVDSIGKRKGLIIGNFLVSISILILILGDGASALLVSNLVMAIGYVMKELCEDTILSDSIPTSDSKPNIFSKLDGKGSTYYYYIDAISAICTGFMFVANNYLPMIICFVFCLISTLISYSFQDLTPSSTSYKSSGLKNVKEYLKNLEHAFKFIFRSSRLRSLLLFSSLMYSFLNVFTTFRSNILVELKLPEQYFGIVVALGQIVSAICTKRLLWFHAKFRNKLLTWLALPVSILLIITGLFMLCNFNIGVIAFICIILIGMNYIIKGPYYSLIKRYYTSFSSPDINTKIYAAKSIIESLVRIPVFLFASFLLDISSLDYTLIVFGCILTIAFIFVLDYMKPRIGLKPEEYKKKDIEYTMLH